MKLDEIQEKPIKRPLESDRWTMKQGNGRHGSLDGVINDAHSLRVLCVSTNSQPEAARCQPKAAERRPNGERASSFSLFLGFFCCLSGFFCFLGFSPHFIIPPPFSRRDFSFLCFPPSLMDRRQETHLARPSCIYSLHIFYKYITSVH